MSPDEKAIATRLATSIRRLRIQRRWSQATLAERMDISVVYAGQLERGERLPALPMICRIAELFGVGLDELVSIKDDRADVGWQGDVLAILGSMSPDRRDAAVAMIRGLDAFASKGNVAKIVSSPAAVRRAEVKKRSHKRLKARVRDA